MNFFQRRKNKERRERRREERGKPWREKTEKIEGKGVKRDLFFV